MLIFGFKTYYKARSEHLWYQNVSLFIQTYDFSNFSKTELWISTNCKCIVLPLSIIVIGLRSTKALDTVEYLKPMIT